MSELLSPDAAKRFSRQAIVRGGVTIILPVALAACSQKEKELTIIKETPGSSIDAAKEKELLLPKYSLTELNNPDIIQGLIGTEIQTDGLLSIQDQDISFYNLYGQTFQGDSQASDQYEDLTYLLFDNPADTSAKLYAVQRRDYGLTIGYASYEEHRTVITNPEQRWLITGTIQQGKVETGNGSDKYVNAPYIHVAHAYSL